MKIPDGHALVFVNAQGRTNDLKDLGVEPGDLFLGHRYNDGTIVLQPAHVVLDSEHPGIYPKATEVSTKPQE